MRHDRRISEIVELLRSRGDAVTGNEIAKQLGISRQLVVQLIRRAREEGFRIISSVKGYSLKERQLARRVIVVQHAAEDIGDELRTIVAEGARVIDVIVRHPVYGEIKGDLNLETDEDVSRFLALLRGSGGAPLLSLSKDGVHMHTIEAADQHVIDRIVQMLDEKGYLLK